MYYGEDRGAQIEITNSTFRSSSFCKGLVYYSKFESISFTQAPTLLNFTANFKGKNESDFVDQDALNYIRIENSSFKNIGFQQVIDALTMKTNTTANSAQAFVSSVPFRKFMN